MIAFLLAFVAVPAASLDLGCQTVWPGPSNGNDIRDCLRGRLPSIDFWFVLSPAILLAFFGVLAILIFVPFFFARQCCNKCGGNVMRPGTCCGGGEEWDDRQEEAARTYPYSRVRCFKASTIFVLIGSVAATVLMVYGVVVLPRRVHEIEQSIRVDAIDFLKSLLTRVEVLATGTPTFPFTSLNSIISATQTAVADAESQFNSAISIVNRYTLAVRVVLAVVAAVPTITALLTVALMCCSVRRIGPALCGCWTFWWTVVFFLLGTLMMVILAVVLYACGEYDLAETFRPGVVQWYLVPLCSASNPVESIATTGNAAILDLSRSACTEMLRVCSNSSTFDPSSPQIAFDCDLSSASVQTQCVSPTVVEGLVNTSVAKAPGLCSGCTISTCPTQCTSEDVRNISSSIVDGVAYGVLADNTLNELAPQLSCDAIILRVLSPLTKCTDIRNEVAVLAVGCAWGAMVLAVLIITQFKGQKWFFSYDELGKSGGM